MRHCSEKLCRPRQPPGRAADLGVMQPVGVGGKKIKQGSPRHGLRRRRAARLAAALRQDAGVLRSWRRGRLNSTSDAAPAAAVGLKNARKAARQGHLILAILVLCLGAPTTPTVSTALAQSVTIDRDGVRIDRRSRGIDRREAIRIAERNGIHRVRDARLRGRDWIVRGETRRRRDLLRLTINARSGRVVGRRYTNR